MSTLVMYITARVELEVNDASISHEEIFNDLDYNFDTGSSGATVVDTELTEFTIRD